MKISATVLPRCCKSLLVLAALVSVLTPASVSAAEKQTDDRKLAALLAERMGVVAAEGRRFAAARDALAKARLATNQRLEDNLVSLEEAKALDLRAWKVVGATFRLQLFEEVIATTDEVAQQRQARAERRQDQERDLAQTRSAVNFKGAQLLASARSLAALAEPPSRSDRVEFFNQLALELSGTTGDGVDKANGGEILAKKLAKKFLDQALGDKVILPELPLLDDSAPAPAD